jgi:DNA mismatch endonuclease (patch repair protein)
MRRIRSGGTKPELIVRKMLRSLGYTGYRLHRANLPGKPDIAFVGLKLAIQVHGCFWHGHTCDEGLRRPKSNQPYWNPKIEGNIARDKRNAGALRLLGWRQLVIWDCELSKPKNVEQRLRKFLSGEGMPQAERLNCLPPCDPRHPRRM